MDSTVDAFQKLNEKTKYKIQIQDRTYAVSITQIRDERFRLSDAEKMYWFPEVYEEKKE